MTSRKPESRSIARIRVLDENPGMWARNDSWVGPSPTYRMMDAQGEFVADFLTIVDIADALLEHLKIEVAE